MGAASVNSVRRVVKKVVQSPALRRLLRGIGIVFDEFSAPTGSESLRFRVLPKEEPLTLSGVRRLVRNAKRGKKIDPELRNTRAYDILAKSDDPHDKGLAEWLKSYQDGASATFTSDSFGRVPLFIAPGRAVRRDAGVAVRGLAAAVDEAFHVVGHQGLRWNGKEYGVAPAASVAARGVGGLFERGVGAAAGVHLNPQGWAASMVKGVEAAGRTITSKNLLGPVFLGLGLRAYQAPRKAADKAAATPDAQGSSKTADAAAQAAADDSQRLDRLKLLAGSLQAGGAGPTGDQVSDRQNQDYVLKTVNDSYGIADAGMQQEAQQYRDMVADRLATEDGWLKRGKELVDEVAQKRYYRRLDDMDNEEFEKKAGDLAQAISALAIRGEITPLGARLATTYIDSALKPAPDAAQPKGDM